MDDALQRALRMNQVLVGAMMMGLVMFALVGATLVQMGTMGSIDSEFEVLMLGLAGVLWLGSVAGAVVVGQSMAAQARQAWDATPGESPEELLPQYSTMSIVRAALLEGPGLFGTVVLLLTGEWWALAVPALSLAGLVLIFPTHDRFARFAARVMGRPVM